MRHRPLNEPFRDYPGTRYGKPMPRSWKVGFIASSKVLALAAAWAALSGVTIWALTLI